MSNNEELIKEIDKYYRAHFSHLIVEKNLPNSVMPEQDYFYVSHLESDGSPSKIIALIPPIKNNENSSNR